ncbi:NAD(P)/FAD-dependent oxidoreductase [Microbulbifer sp. S227A]|uniref:NAD(P)/FAD-dependent oxidoreductase n=1 Tax=Microbulbifer sp. S227A TaxID=3415131 RepID=UPI003C7DE575
MTQPPPSPSVVVIGAGPSGTVAASLLARRGVDVLVLEKAHFPRFSIGESLLPQSMEFIERAGLLDAVKARGFQFKDGAAFDFGDIRNHISFASKTAAGWDTTFQVQRAEFDKCLADAAAGNGVDIRYGHGVEAIALDESGAHLVVTDDAGQRLDIRTRFVVDASGYGRVLPRLLGLDRPSDFPMRQALFTHVADRLKGKPFDRDKILITVHPEQAAIWYWLIPFSDGTASVGVVAPPERLPGGTPSEQLWNLIGQAPNLSALLQDATQTRQVSGLKGYSSNVSTLCGQNFALLGNAGEFLDPVFSSGVTVAMKSADLLIDPLMRQLNGETVDWKTDFERPLKLGVDCFRAFVETWYDGSLQQIIRNPPPGDNPVKRMIASVLAGYAWDEKNPFVTRPRHYLAIVADQCA